MIGISLRSPPAWSKIRFWSQPAWLEIRFWSLPAWLKIWFRRFGPKTAGWQTPQSGLQLHRLFTNPNEMFLSPLLPCCFLTTPILVVLLEGWRPHHTCWLLLWASASDDRLQFLTDDRDLLGKISYASRPGKSISDQCWLYLVNFFSRKRDFLQNTYSTCI